ncbi:MAG: peptidoglycan DD-metalloendopeptidase family protein [Flavobacteriales bacterium]|nr:peptidoglycan DD-metalloendopeptidase family protein [Flavobacteriales bacterium]
MRINVFAVFLLIALIEPSLFGAIPTNPPGQGTELPASKFYSNFDTSACHYRADEFEFISETSLKLVWTSTCDYVHPFQGHVTSKFGKRRRRMHYGTDIDLETGDKVQVAFEGIVRYAKYNKSYGNLVVVRHPNGLETYYAHLSAIEVKSGDYLQAGDVVGLGGNTGHSFGSHLHFEARFLGMPIDPVLLIDFDKMTLRYTDIILKKRKDRLVVENAARFHQVQAGEDIHSIARMYNVSVSDVSRLNHISPEDPILIDSRIRYQ